MTAQAEPRSDLAPADLESPAPAGAYGWGWGRWLWRSLTSMRTAVILLGLLGAAAIPGSLLPQRNVATSPSAVPNFVTEYPTISPWLDRLSLFDVYASPWFAAIYLLLLVSMTGCVLPRCVRLWDAVRTPPPSAPRNLTRLDDYQSWDSDRAPSALLEDARAALRERGFRVVVGKDQVRAERGYLREVGNLLFHLSFLVLLFGVAAGRLLGFEGRVALAEGSSFTNVQSEYDAFTPSVWTDTERLEPFSMRLEDFAVEYESNGAQRGQPRDFSADVTYQTGMAGATRQVTVAPNGPLDVNETKMFLTGHGYAPQVTVRDGDGNTVVSGPVIFLPNDSSFASDGVIKAPDALPTQLGFEGFFLPTAAVGDNGPYSAFPDTLNPRLVLTAYTGDIGLGDGVPQSVFALDKSKMTQVRESNGQPFIRALSVGETMTLPGGRGSITFDGVSRFANFQVAYDPGKEIVLLAALMLLIGLTTSLAVRRRRIWVRVSNGGDQTPTRVEVARMSLTRHPLSTSSESDAVLAALGRPVHSPAVAGKEPRS